MGFAYLVSPGRTTRGWVGRAASVPATQVFARGHGARDIALGAGALTALASADPGAARMWFAGQALADAADLLATMAARRPLPARGFRFAVTMAGTSAAIATAAAIGTGRRASPRR